MEEKRKGDGSSTQTARIITSIKTLAPKSKDPYVIKAMERAKSQLRDRLLELSEN